MVDIPIVPDFERPETVGKLEPVQAVPVSSADCRRAQRLSSLSGELAGASSLPSSFEKSLSLSLDAGDLVSPPISNRGVMSAECSTFPQKEALIDYLRFTIRDMNLAEVLSWVGGSAENFTHLDYGGYRYRKRCHFGGITVYYDGSEPMMGICVQMSGEGCRQFEALAGFKGWSFMLAALTPQPEERSHCDRHITRLDVALDDRSGALDLRRIREMVEAGEYTSPSSRFKVEASGVRGENRQGVTVYIGSRESERMCRFYDWQAKHGGDEPCVRVELETKGDTAHRLAELLVKEGLAAVAGVLREFVEFKEPGRNKQMCRRETCAWWVAFLEGWNKLRVAVKPAVASWQKVYAWFERQCGPTLALVHAVLQREPGALKGLIEDGRKRWKPKHRDVLNMATALRLAAVSDAPTGF